MGSRCLLGTVSVWNDKNVLKIHRGDGYTTCEYIFNTT